MNGRKTEVFVKQSNNCSINVFIVDSRLTKAEEIQCFCPTATNGIKSNQVETVIQHRIIELRR